LKFQWFVRRCVATNESLAQALSPKLFEANLPLSRHRESWGTLADPHHTIRTRPLAIKRLRHLPTFGIDTPIRRAMEMFSSPSAEDNPCSHHQRVGAFNDLVNSTNVLRSKSVKTISCVFGRPFFM
jgi:hypothetical protein